MAIDADGSPRAYAPPPKEGLDYLANAGHPGNWWGLACDQHGEPYVQLADNPAPGFYVSTTTYERREFNPDDPRRYLNSETEKFVVVPNSFRKSVPGIVLGCKCLVSYRDKTVEAVAGDVGPRFGEGSIALAKALGIPSDPKSGGVDSGVTYQLFPGVAATGYELQRA